MKVLYINYLFDKTYSSVGAAVHVQEFVKATRKQGVNIIAQDLNKFGDETKAVQSPFRAWLKKHLSKYVGQLNALKSNIAYFRNEWRLVSEHRPDALLVRYNLLNFSAPLVARLKKIPLVLEVNAPMALESRKYGHNWNLPFVPEWAERLNLKMASRTYTVSTALKNYFIEAGIAAEKISVVPNGVDTDRFHPDTNASDIREGYGLQGKVVVGFIGSFHYWHGVECFPQYVADLCERHKNCHFLFVGDGPLRSDLENDISERGLADRVTFSGYVEHQDVPEHLAAMDIVVAPYPVMEFFYFSPLKLFEYMAAGKAVVASRVGQIEEMVQDGDNGMLYDAGDVEKFRTISSRLIEDQSLRLKLGASARETMCRHFSWQKNAAGVINLLQASLSEQVARPAVVSSPETEENRIKEKRIVAE